MKRLLMVLALALCIVAPVQAQRYDGIAMATSGQPVRNAVVAVCTQPAVTQMTGCLPLATLYTDSTLTTVAPNPFTGDAFGNYHFYANPADGPFTVEIYGANIATPFVQKDQLSNNGIVGGFLSGTISGSPIFSGNPTFNSPISVLSGGTGTSSPVMTAGAGIALAGSFPNYTVTNSDDAYFSGGVLSVAHGGMAYPGAGVANSTGSAWGTSYQVGTAANNLLQLNASSKLPAVDGSLLTGLLYSQLGGTVPTWNQSTTGNAATATALAAAPAQCLGSQFATGVAANGNANCSTPSGFSVIAKSQSGLVTTSTGQQLVTVVNPSSGTVYLVQVIVEDTTAASGCSTNPVVNAYITGTDAANSSTIVQPGGNFVLTVLNSVTFTASVNVKASTNLQAGINVSTAGSGCTTNAIVATQIRAVPE